MVEDAIRRCLISAVTNVNLSDLSDSTAGSFVERPGSAAVTAPMQEMFRRLNQAQACLYDSLPLTSL
jgi:hypothetical protein